LYEILEEKGENVLYFDTDSLIYVLKPDEEPLKLGNN
jgi:DNA polymerase elongation subunit (family B)